MVTIDNIMLLNYAKRQEIILWHFHYNKQGDQFELGHSLNRKKLKFYQGFEPGPVSQRAISSTGLRHHRCFVRISFNSDENIQS